MTQRGRFRQDMEKLQAEAVALQEAQSQAMQQLKVAIGAENPMDVESTTPLTPCGSAEDRAAWDLLLQTTKEEETAWLKTARDMVKEASKVQSNMAGVGLWCPPLPGPAPGVCLLPHKPRLRAVLCSPFRTMCRIWKGSMQAATPT